MTEKSSSHDLPNCLKLILFAILSKVGNEKDAFFRLDIYVRPHTADSKIHLVIVDTMMMITFSDNDGEQLI